MSQRQEFVEFARQQAVPLAELCRRFGISRKTGYKWLGRDVFADRSRRPLTSPRCTAAAIEAEVLALRERHPVWGGRKIARRLRDLGHGEVPHPSTITHILKRHGMLAPQRAGAGARYRRFEHPVPNALWQWISRAISPCVRGVVTRSPCSTITPAMRSRCMPVRARIGVKCSRCW
jgi:transposase-like protein